MSTVRKILEASLRKCGGILAAGEPADDYMIQNTLYCLELMLDSWSTENLSIHAVLDQKVTWPAGTSTITFGPTGDKQGTWPYALQPSTNYVKDSKTYPITIIDYAGYSSITDKSRVSNDLKYLAVHKTVPNISLSIYPVPSTDVEVHLHSLMALSLPQSEKIMPLPVVLPFTFVGETDLSGELYLPPGYERAIIFNLAIEICAEYGVEPATSVLRVASTSKKLIKRSNSDKTILSLPSIITRRRVYNIEEG